jgi:hypothetical protein
MADPAQPQFVVRRIQPGANQRRLLLLAVALLLAAALGVAVGYRLAAHPAAPSRASSDPAAAVSAADYDDLAQQVVNLKRSEQVARIAADGLRHTLADREEEISALRTDLAFYSRLVGSGEQGQGLMLHSVHLQSIPGSRAYNATLILTQNANRGEDNHGTVELAVEGVRGGKLVLLEGGDLGDASGKDGMHYAFKYFQQLHATLMLPADFTPNRLRVTIRPDGGSEDQHNIAWTDALKPTEESDVQ